IDAGPRQWKQFSSLQNAVISSFVSLVAPTAPAAAPQPVPALYSAAAAATPPAAPASQPVLLKHLREVRLYFINPVSFCDSNVMARVNRMLSELKEHGKPLCPNGSVIATRSLLNGDIVLVADSANNRAILKRVKQHGRSLFARNPINLTARTYTVIAHGMPVPMLPNKTQKDNIERLGLQNPMLKGAVDIKRTFWRKKGATKHRCANCHEHHAASSSNCSRFEAELVRLRRARLLRPLKYDKIEISTTAAAAAATPAAPTSTAIVCCPSSPPSHRPAYTVTGLHKRARHSGPDSDDEFMAEAMPAGHSTAIAITVPKREAPPAPSRGP
ncbi:hypothetical protein KEM52_001376, partial [Ascosphaera acerosa]